MPDQMPSTAPLARRISRLLLTLVPALLLAGPSQALTDEEVFRAMRFQSPAPGARALGLGGAFIGLADDATAAATNPAGIGFLSRPEFLLEVKGFDRDAEVFLPDGTFDLSGVETYASGTVLIDEEAHAAPSYVSYVHPLNDRWVLGVHRHERHDVEREVSVSYLSSAFPALENSSGLIPREALGTSGNLDLLMDTWGASVGWALHEQFSLGLTVSFARLDVAGRTDNFQGVLFDGNANGQPDALLQSLDYSTVIDDDDTAVTFTAGLLWKAHPKISVGAVYRDGPEFDLVQQVLPDGLRAKELRDFLSSPNSQGVIVANALGEFINTFSTPDSYGVGMAFGPFFEPRGGGGLMITADAVRVEYTDLLENFVAGLDNQLFAADSTGVIFEMEDETELHLGVGYSWTVGYNNKVHVRAGVYNEPDQSIVTAGRTSGVVSPVTQDLVRPGSFFGRADEDNVHVTLGGGMTLKRGFYSFSLDAVADFSDLGEEYSGTASFRF